METTTLKLTNETIDFLSDELSSHMSENKVSSRDILRYRLGLEEILIKYQEKFGPETNIVYLKKRAFGEIRFTIKINCPEYNPLAISFDDSDNTIMSSLVNSFEKGEPMWSYSDQINVITFNAKKKANFGKLPQIGLGVVLAFVLGIIARNVFDPTGLKTFVDTYLTPLGNVYAGCIAVFGVLLVFFDIALGIVNSGDLNTAGKVGKRISGGFFIYLILFVVVLSLPLVFMYNTGTNEVKTSADSVYSLLLSLLPQNIVSPFLEFNAIQVIIIGVAFGVSILVLGDKANTLKKVFNEVDLVAIVTNVYIDKIIAVYAFVVLFGLVSTAELTVLRYSAELIAAVLIGLLLMLMITIARASFLTKINPFKLFKKILPSFLLCLGTGSYGASFTVNVGIIRNDLAINGNYASIGMEFGGNLYKPAQAFTFLAMSIFVADYYNIRITIPWFVIACLLSIILSIAVPNIPGGAATIIPLLFTQLSLPYEGITWMIVLSALLQFPILAVNINCIQCGLLSIASKCGMVDKEKLLA